MVFDTLPKFMGNSQLLFIERDVVGELRIVDDGMVIVV
jgi:hypothetical protein